MELGPCMLQSVLFTIFWNKLPMWLDFSTITQRINPLILACAKSGGLCSACFFKVHTPNVIVKNIIIMLCEWKFSDVNERKRSCMDLSLMFFQSSATFASTYVLVAMSIDRLDAIARPMNFTGSGKFTHLQLILSFSAIAVNRRANRVYPLGKMLFYFHVSLLASVVWTKVRRTFF